MMATEARSEVGVVMVRVHCAGVKKDGRMCNHVVATVNIEQWELQRELDTTVECKRCGRVERLSKFM